MPPKKAQEPKSQPAPASKKASTVEVAPKGKTAAAAKTASSNPQDVAAISKGQSKSQRKATNAAIEADRLREREKMEAMTMDEEEEIDGTGNVKGNVFSQIMKNATKAQLALGAGETRDSFGNTISKKKLEGDKLLEKQRAEARARREAKFAQQAVADVIAAAEAEASADPNSGDAVPIDQGGKISKKKSSTATGMHDNSRSMTRAEEIADIRARAARGEKVSNKEKKVLKKYEESEAEEAALIAEFESGLANFSLSVSGRATDDYDSDNDEDNATLSAVDIIVPDFTITAPQRVLFQDASLRLVSGRRYGLLGPNGRGKSTLLKFIAARRLPVPRGISMLMVEQEVPPSHDSVVDQVLASDVRRGSLMAEETVLMETLERLEATGEDGDGAANGDSDVGDDDDDDNNYDDDNDDRKAEAEKQLSELSKLVDRLQAVGAELDAIGAYGGEAKVRRILTGLGFTDGMQNNSSMTLSGGWRVRVSLAKALFMEPRLLLLDEPTNHLDLDAVLWLDEYLSVHWKGTILIVSHDADFLDSVCTDILHIDEAKLNAYSGNITSFEKMRGQIEAKKQREWKLQQKTLKEFHTQGMNAEKAAKRTMEKLELSSLIMEQPREYRVKFNFKSAEDDMPSISFLDVGFSYGVSGATTASASTSASAAGGGGKKLPPLFDGLRFSIGSSSRIAIVGPNGTGKTTLLKLMTKRLEPTSGEVSHHQKLRIGIYDQHFEELLPLNLTSIAYLTSQYDVTDLEARKYLGMFGLDGARHLIRIGELSGGQKARVVFAALALKRPHILILDEPTNHLDLESVEALIEALKEFQGGIVLVSHDARLITATESEIWVCEGGLTGADGIIGTGLRVDRRGFESYRKDVVRHIERKAAEAERVAQIKADKRRSDREVHLANAREKKRLAAAAAAVSGAGSNGRR